MAKKMYIFVKSVCFFVFLCAFLYFCVCYCVFSYWGFSVTLDFGLKMGVGLTFSGKKADLCTKNARVMNKKADFFKKMRKSDCICCVYLYKFWIEKAGAVEKQVRFFFNGL
ncbi:MAG: hypothetical protein ACYS1A_11940 [Planctomycetota bacterium]|jgi:hypothetical protein